MTEVYQFKGCIWRGTMNGKPVFIMKYEDRFSIEVTIKELKSYLGVESNYFEVKESNYGYIFLLCLVYNFAQYLRLYITNKSFKDILDGLSAHLLWRRPPKSAALMVDALKEAYINIGCNSVNKMNDCLVEVILTSG